MRKKTRYSLALFLNILALFPNILLPTASKALPLTSDQVPSVVPRHASFPVHYNNHQPEEWNSAAHWGESFGQGHIDVKDIKMICMVNGREQVVFNDLNNLGAGKYNLDPWYVGDFQGPLRIQRIDDFVRIPVESSYISHWWPSRRPNNLQNARDCRVESTIRASEGVFFSIGADWWIDSTSGWAGDMVNNRYMGRSAWFDHRGGWQTVVFE